LASKKNRNRNNTVTKTGKPELLEIAVAQVYDKYSTYPSNGLTPVRLAQIFREADAGDVMRQMELFEEMEGKDTHLFSQLQTRKNAVTGLDYEINPFSDDEQDKVIAEFVKQEIEAIENFEDIMTDLLDAIGKGISVSEILWEYDEGKTSIKDIKWRHPKRFFWDTDDIFKVITKENPQGIEIPENKFIIHRYKARSGHPSRAGVLRVVAWMYLFKNYDIKDWVSFCEVFGMPLRLGKYNPSASEEDKMALMRALVQIGTDAAGIIPDGTEIEFKEASKTTSINVYESLARYCDEQMSKAILGQTLTSDSGGGSYAQSKTHNEVRHDLTAADCKALAATLRRDLIKPLVYFNFGEDKRIPYLRFDCEEAGDQKETADIYEKLICNIGLKIPTSHIYKKFSIPKPENGEEVATPPAQAAAPATPLSTSTPPPSSTEGVVVNKEEPGVITGNQEQADQLADASLEKSKGVFEKIFAPVLKLLDGAESLEELKLKLDEESYVRQLYKEMDVEDLDELLHKAMFYADMFGRVKENGKPV
jgi:phage gp29-like protein